MSDTGTPYFPLTAFAGYAAARKALMALLVDPSLRGLLLAGRVGTGKSALARSFGAFVQRHVDPGAPFVHVPAAVGDDRLIGGLDIDAAFATGRRHGRQGLIADADGGVLFTDDAPLLEEHALGAIAAALETGRVLCEREGLAMHHPANFIVVATAVPSERELPFWFADKLAFLMGQEKRLNADLAHMMVARVERYRRAPGEVMREYDASERALAAQVITARARYGMINIGPVVLERLADAAMKLDVAGNRVDVFAAKAARAHAALRGGAQIEEIDITFAIAGVIAPRSRSAAADLDGGERREDSPETPQVEEAVLRRQQGGDAGGEPEHAEEARGDEREEESDSDRSENASAAERVQDPLDFHGELPPMEQFLAAQRRATVSGSRGERSQWHRGKHVRSLQCDPRGKRIAVGATLRAAAPHQRARRAEAERRVVVRAEDLRLKRFSERAGTLFIFCVDASGSMALNRMREAKGAVTQLLTEAYVNRDSVALVAFRGADAEVLLPPTNSVERAKRSLDILPTGGGTPLAAALMKAYGLVAAARRKGADRVLVVVLTDGRANVPMAESAAGMIMEIRRRHVRQELDRVGVVYRREGITTLVVDTRHTYGAQSEAVRLAERLAARYYYLPTFDAHGLAAVAREASTQRA